SLRTLLDPIGPAHVAPQGPDRRHRPRRLLTGGAPHRSALPRREPGDGFVRNEDGEGPGMLKFLLWCLLLVVCWPLALLALVLYLPFRIVGIAVEGAFELLRAVIFLPARLLGGRRAT